MTLSLPSPLLRVFAFIRTGNQTILGITCQAQKTRRTLVLPLVFDQMIQIYGPAAHCRPLPRRRSNRTNPARGLGRIGPLLWALMNSSQWQ